MMIGTEGRVDMFTIEQINDLHGRLGSAKTLPEDVRALKALGIEADDSYLADGPPEDLGQDGQRIVSPPAHEVLAIAESGQREMFLQHLRWHEQGPDDVLRDVHGTCAERDR